MQIDKTALGSNHKELSNKEKHKQPKIRKQQTEVENVKDVLKQLHTRKIV